MSNESDLYFDTLTINDYKKNEEFDWSWFYVQWNRFFIDTLLILEINDFKKNEEPDWIFIKMKVNK